MTAPSVLLLQAPIKVRREDAPTFGFFPPLGLAYLASVLLRDGYEVEVHDLLVEGERLVEPAGDGMVRIGLPKQDIFQRLRQKAPAVVGISNNFTSFSPECLRLAGIVRESLPEAIIVMGGAHASAEAKAILATGVLDAVVIGEGEYVFRDLVEAVLGGRLEVARRIQGTTWMVGGEVIDNGVCAPISDLDAIPFPAYHLLPMEKYIWQKKANFAVAMRHPIGHMITTRGCPYRCIFCSTTKHFKKFRKRSPENVLAEMEELIRCYGIREFHFHDDNFVVDREHVRTLCTMMLQRGMDIRWQLSQGVNTTHLDGELLELMHRSGMYRVGFPIESGCPETLRFIRKPLRLDKVKTLIEKCNRLGIYCFGCFMIGFPEETREQVQQTRDFILNSGLDYVKLAVTQPLAGSPLYSVYERLNLLNEAAESSTYFHTSYNTVHFKAEELNQIREEVFRSFSRQRIKSLFKRGGIRRFILPKLRSFESILYFLKVGRLALRARY